MIMSTNEMAFLLAKLEIEFRPWTNGGYEQKLMVAERPFFDRLAAIVDGVRKTFPFMDNPPKRDTLSPEMCAVIEDMLDIICDIDSTAAERRGAALTIIDALQPPAPELLTRIRELSVTGNPATPSNMG